MSRPLVSIVITTYNRPKLVKRAVRSARNQTYEHIETIVVEDASQSGIRDWLAARGFDDVKYVRHDDNRGTAAARNTGYAQASGDYVAFLDDDDWYKPRFIQACIDAADALPSDSRERLGVVYTALEVRSPETEEVLAVLPPENEGDLEMSIRQRGASTLDSSLFLPAEAIEAVGGWDEALATGEVHDLWMRLAVAGRSAVALDEPLVVTYRQEGSQKTWDTDLRIQGVREYVEKWEPTYREWFGEEAGTAYGERYFARVVGRLAAGKLVYGKPREGLRAARAVFAESNQNVYNLFVLAYGIGEMTIKRFMPPPAVRLIRRFIG